MAKISKKFTYNIADDYLAQTNELGNTAEWTYDGEDKIWVFVDKETNKLHHTNYLTAAEDGETYPTPLHMYKVEIDCNENPLLCTLFGADEIRDYNELPQFSEELPDGHVYSRPLHPTPDHTYEVLDLEYVPTTNTFKEPYPWKKPHMSWQDIRARRNVILTITDDKDLPDMPESVKQKWQAYRQALRDLPQTYGASSGAIPSLDPWKVRFPQDPDGKE